jgi:hypothetical protein
MALRPFNSIEGFSVGESPRLDVIYANGDVSAVNFTASGVSNLGPISNVIITGGSAGQVIQTDGTGNLTFADASGGNNAATMPYQIDVGMSYIVQNNFQGLFSYPITIDGTLDVEGILIEVGTPISAEDTQILFDSESVIAGNSGFTFNRTSGNLNLPGNINVTGNIIPTSNNVVALGNNTNRFSNVWLSGNTIVLGNSTITTDNLGNIILTSASDASFQVGGNANITDLTSGNTGITLMTDSDITFASNGVSNVMVMTSNSLTVHGNVISNGIVTSNIYYANGQPFDFGDAAGQNTWVQYSNGKEFAASANFTYDDSTKLLTVVGNISSNNVSAGYLISSSGCVLVGNGAIAVNGNTGGIFNSSISNINIGLNANTVYLGSSSGNVTTTNDFVSNGNITTNNTVIANNIQVADLYSKRTPISVPTSDTVIDSFPVSSYRSAKYTIKASSDLGYQALEVLLLQDNINTYITVYASLSSAVLGAETILVTANIASGNVNLLATPYSSNTIVNLMGTYVPD